MIKKLISVLAVVVASATLSVPAAQANPPCVTKREYRHVHVPMTEARVRRIFDTPGHVVTRNGPNLVRSYTPCRGLRGVSVFFKNGRMTNKSKVVR